MPRVMTVDDSRAVRSIVSKQLVSAGIEVEEAEDGQQALEKLQDVVVDLILLDVTMPVMDGPTMLANLRKTGNRTPVVMLTSESKRSVIAEAMKAGIDDYILKPFKPEELMAKVHKSLKTQGAVAATAVAAVAAPAPMMAAPMAAPPPPATSSGEARQFIDVLVVDDMENVIKRVRALVPEFVSVLGVTSAQAALQACRDKVCRTVLIDADLPDFNAGLLASQIRILQPHASILSMPVRGGDASAVLDDAKQKGFNDILMKPFAPESIDDFVLQYFDRQDMISREDNVLKLSAYAGKPERVDRYFSRLGNLIGPQIETIAAACFEGVVVDLTKAPAAPEKMPKLLVDLCGQARQFGLRICVVGQAEMQKMLGLFEETKSVPFFTELSQARAEVG